ncbi:MAG: hypothetical protein E7383_07705 [Ruminococcaceae bacterium]|nr:hypothetical protein [Oscillospiraceae bacterium]
MPGEIDPDHAHLIGLETAQKIWGDSGYQVVVATHIDREHIHNHFIINSVSLNGEKDPCCYHRKISAISDDIIHQHGLSIITERGISPATLPHYSRRQLAAKLDIDEGLALCTDLKEFRRYMSDRGYVLDLSENRMYWTIQHKDWQRPMRLIRLGDNYSNDRILYRLEHENMIMPDEYSQREMSSYQLYLYENRYSRIQKNWKNTYQYKFFMFMLKNFDINLNDYQTRSEHMTRQQKKDYDQVWKSLRSVSVLAELGVKTTEDVVAAFLSLDQKIATYEEQQRQLRNQLRSTNRNPDLSDLESDLRYSLSDVNKTLKELRDKKKILASITAESILSVEPTPEPETEPEK